MTSASIDSIRKNRETPDRNAPLRGGEMNRPEFCGPFAAVAGGGTLSSELLTFPIDSNVSWPADANYPNNRDPLSQSCYVKLPLGAVHPSRWLLDQPALQARGIPSYHTELRDVIEESAWKGDTGKNVTDGFRGAGWPSAQQATNGMSFMRDVIFALLSLTVLVSAAMATGTASAQTAPSSQVVSMRRLTQAEYLNSIADIFGTEIEVRGRFEPTIRIGGLQAASTSVLSVTPVGFESFTELADSIASQVTREKYRAKLRCVPKSAREPDDTCTAQLLRHYGRMLYRRPLTEDEIKSAVNLSHRLAEAQNDFYAGLRYGLASLLQAPAFVFRMETAVPAGVEQWALDSYSRATRLSYLMWDSTPDAELLQAAEKGDLNTAAGLEKQVDRLMSSPRLDIGMRAFFNDMLELDNFDAVSKDSILFPKWSSVIAASAKEETLRTVIDLALHSNGDMRDLMTTRKTFLNRSLAADYQLPFRFDGEWASYEFAPDSGRSGILTQASMMAMFSHPGRSSPTKRGVAVMDIFLCEPTPPPPPNVDFSVVNDTSGPLKTVRERLVAHASNSSCASCHNHSDPIGLSLEGFDTIGQRRTMENGKLIDLSATMQGRHFGGAEGLGQFMHDNPKYTLCLARKVYAYSNGANSEDVAGSAFKTAYQAFADSGFRMRSLLKSMVEDKDYFNAPPPSSETTSSAPTPPPGR
ncbi:DUF1592 domain-containing protein [Bradyrhizobium sp. Arg68]|uniref:DUF1592 domain-containing protein n=1 Tax=Bradyrhizobium ivorense TaxID=2511166 RepID=UPI001E508F00|nr:DUF1592 domain-containing protein [Bradyrhizobium ivorense]MCC8935891.1 DUF1592 domain-containing protein [Bradyrhizobium ivorense]